MEIKANNNNQGFLANSVSEQTKSDIYQFWLSNPENTHKIIADRFGLETRHIKAIIDIKFKERLNPIAK